jgi:exosortase A-associated hydrolase 2
MTAASRSTPFEPVMIEGIAGPVLAIHHVPRMRHARARGVVYLPPFAEEMNRARRMATLQAQALAAAGDGVLILDPYGSGDSGGEFGDARWETWQNDAARAISWMHQRGYDSVVLLGLRLGALLALDAARDPAANISRVVLWQPVLRGEQMMTQFLRLRLAAELSSGKKANESTAEIRKALAADAFVEIAGYRLHRDLVASIDTLKLVDLGLSCRAAIDWIEVVAQPDQAPSPAHEPVAAHWREAGLAFRQHKVVGEPFWTLQETAIAPALLALTSELLKGPA